MTTYRDPEAVVVGGLKVARLTRSALVRKMVTDCLAARLRIGAAAKTVFAANGQTVSLAATRASFKRLFDEADIVHADGQALVFASHLTGTPIPERSATTDLIHDAAGAAVKAGLRFYLLGGTEDVNARCAEALVARHPGLQIVGRRNGFFRHEDEPRLCEEINRARPDVVWVGLGAPLEYDFASRNKHRIDTAWIVPCGGCFNFVTGDYKRAPLFMQKIGLEWLHRLGREPRRLFFRYALTNPIALFMLLARSAATGQGALR